MADHEASECKINETPNLTPDMDCGHYVDSGPATKSTGGDLNTYTEKNGDKVVVAGMPKHNLDQQVNAGPGTQAASKENTYTTKNGDSVIVAGK